ncbi:LysR family transcriptional regulator [Vibrio anguillarum]|nr:LysR family transcriptional regulator [Vibrio anguillarum]
MDAGNLTKASELLDLPKSNLSRRIKNLEIELKVSLFHRHQRAITLSENGRLFYPRTQPLLADFDSVIEDMTHDSLELNGHLRLQLLPLPGVDVFEKSVFKFMEKHPKVHIEIIINADDRNLIKDNIDIAIRIGKQLENSSLIARPLKTITMGYYASPNYLEKYGHPHTEDELKQHNFIIQRMPDGKLARQFPLSNGQTFQAKGKLVVNDIALITSACIKHQGIIYHPNHLAKPEVEKGKLVHLLTKTDSIKYTGWLVYPNRSSLSRAAKALIEFIYKEVEPLVIE